MNSICRAFNILFHPQREWEAISMETPAPLALWRGYVLPFSAIAPFASMIGLSFICKNPAAGENLKLPLNARSPPFADVRGAAADGINLGLAD